MKLFSQMGSWLETVLHRSRVEREMEEELQSHIEEHTRELIRSGVQADIAARRARLEFGTVSTTKDACREALGLRLWDELRADLRYGWRQLSRTPGLALVIIVSLAVGIGAATALFSLIYSLLINPLPYRGAERIVRLSAHGKAGDSLLYLSGPQIRQLRDSPAIESVLAVDYHERTLSGYDLPENVHTIYTSSNTFEDLGVSPVLGRGLERTDAPEGQDPQMVAVLGYRFWRRQFVSDPNVIGKTLELDRKTYVIVGVAAPRFAWYEADVYLPLKLTADPNLIYLVNLRLKPGVTQRSANASLQPLLERFAKDNPPQFDLFGGTFSVRVNGYNQGNANRLNGILYPMFAAVLLLLAIGCANASILLLARGIARQHELSVRIAIGAHRHRIVRQLLTETLLLASVGVLLGVAISYTILSAFQSSLPSFLYASEVAFTVDIRVLLLSGAAALITSILFGLLPALQASQAQPAWAIQSGVRRVTAGPRRQRTHRTLIAGQVAVTLLLLTAAGAATRAFLRLTHTELGYDAHNVLNVGIVLRDSSYPTHESRAIYFDRLRSEVAGITGVGAAALTDSIPPRSYRTMRMEIPGTDSADLVRFNPVSPEYFDVLRIPVLQGRVWTGAENTDSAPVVMINRTLARRYFPDRNPIGASIRLPGIVDFPSRILSAPGIGQSELRVVGIVEDSRNDGLKNPVQPAVFVPYTLMMRNSYSILVKSAAPAEALLHAVRTRIAAVNPDQQTFSQVQTLESELSHLPEWRQEQSAAWILGIFSVLAVGLGAVGLYSVMSYTVAERIHEFGIRMALGARTTDVVRIVLASSFVNAGGGVLCGLGLTLAARTVVSRWISGDLLDPAILLAALLVLGSASVAASVIPAWRASRVDPMVAIRRE